MKNFHAQDGEFSPEQLGHIRQDLHPGIKTRFIAALTHTDTAPRILGCDVSKWQGAVNFDTMLFAGADFVYIKATQAEFTDSKFYANIEGAQQSEIPFGLYHFADPGVSSAPAQAAYFLARMNEAQPDLGVVLDLERSGGLSPIKLDQWAYTFWAAVRDQTAYAEIYTRISFWNPAVQPGLWGGQARLWAARYADYLTGPWSDGKYVPDDWDDWWLWQYSADGNGRGAEFGAESGSIDLNYMQCTRDEMLDYYGLGGDIPDPDPCPCCAELSARMETYETALGEFDAALQDHDMRILTLEDDQPVDPPVVWTDYIVTASPTLTFRDSPNSVSSNNIIGRIPYNTTIPIDEASATPDAHGGGDWYTTKYNGLTGWVAGWWLKKK